MSDETHTQTPPPQTHVLADVVSVGDGGNSITLHFSEIKSAKAFRDAFPASIVSPATGKHVASVEEVGDPEAWLFHSPSPQPREAGQ